MSYFNEEVELSLYAKFHCSRWPRSCLNIWGWWGAEGADGAEGPEGAEGAEGAEGEGAEGGGEAVDDDEMKEMLDEAIGDGGDYQDARKKH